MIYSSFYELKHVYKFRVCGLHVGATRLTGDLHVGGLQLLVVAEGHSSPVILPMQLNCLFSQHLPSSTLDL